ncbi:hypothetical protein HYH02_000802 [Chlamydomonas schloesseri]|uniref:Fungal lipase-like domain-containing protein n=1 Tax=Chlamydomonas schloesseri TaxID=2026947 RepID=A0A835WWI2_9CHLO|nr:hypothetical protein HYH02_000802 [Chlamydomonas schloesseri]|eukprot:KAG2454976.1 hypothetical protein HYH02_000802 [Chlamydomonas schloesseri]
MFTSLAVSQQAGLLNGWRSISSPRDAAGQSCCSQSRCAKLTWRSTLSSGISAPDTQAWPHAAPRARSTVVAAAVFGVGGLGLGSSNSSNNGGRSEAPAAAQWTEPVQDGLSVADRAILALARAAADVGNKQQAERAAASQGLALVTSSDAWLAPLMPPVGSTIDEDAAEGDGMALPLPMERIAGGGNGQQQRKTLASGASALLSAVLKPRAAGAAAGNGAAGAAASNSGPLPAAAAPAANPIISRRGAPAAVPRVSSGGDRDSDRIVNLAHLAAEGGGGDTTDADTSDDEDAPAYAPHGSFVSNLAAARESAGQVGGKAAAAAGGAAAAASSSLLGSATAAWNRVAAAASGTPAVGRAKAVAAGAATAASAAAHMAGAAVAKATSQLTPNYGDPSSNWLVGDDVEVPGREVRYIAIAAGPELRRRSARELTSELVNFESYNLGAKVNKRLYAEATALYARFMPLVMDFLEAHPHGSVCFGGQGVGGSLAVLLQLMCCHRGLRFARLLPAVAIDAPAVLAQVPSTQRRKWGAGASSSAYATSYPAVRDASTSEDLEDDLEELMSRTVLEELGLPPDAVRNILVLQAGASAAAGQQQQQPHSHDPATQQRLLPGTAGNAGSVGGASPHALVVMAGGGGEGGVVQGKGRQGGSEALRAQVFKLVGKVVQVESLASASSRIKAAAHAAAASSVLSAPIGDARLGGSTTDAEDGAGEAAMNGSVGRNGSPPRKLDAATVGSIASAAATAVASAAAEQLKVVGAGALKAATAGKSAAAGVAASASATASAAASAAGPVGRKAAASVAAAATAAVPAGRKAAASMAAAAVATVVATRPAAAPVSSEAVMAHPMVLSADGDDDDASTWGV